MPGSPVSESQELSCGGPWRPDRRVMGAGFGQAWDMTPSASTETALSAPAVGPVRLADALGWSSSVLGAPMLLAPRRFLRAIGVADEGKAVAWTLGVGVREHVATLNIVANRQRRIGMWSRVAGDTMDLALLAQAYRHKRRDAGRLRGALAFVGGIMALDAYTAIALSRADRVHVRDGEGSTGIGVEHDTSGGPTRVRTAITVFRDEQEVRREFGAFDWRAFDAAELERAGDVRFVPAPGDRGTEIHLDHEPAARGGAPGAVLAKAIGVAPDQSINDDLRRFKSRVETGVPVQSETSPEGPSAFRQIWHKRQPAQPVGGGN
jgi:hypothetical protein